MDKNKPDSIIDNDIIMSEVQTTPNQEIEMMEIENDDSIQIKRTVSGRFTITEIIEKNNYNISCESMNYNNQSQNSNNNNFVKSESMEQFPNDTLIDSFIDEEFSSYYSLNQAKECFQIACLNYGEIFNSYQELYTFISFESEFDGMYYRFKMIKEDHRVTVVMRDINSITDTVYKYHILRYI